jgi:mitotic-spindle organizing protein 1
MADQQQAMQAIEQGEAALNVLAQIAQILDTGLDKETLRLLVGLVEAGVNPEALALIVKELRREAAAVGAPAAASQ